MKNLLLLAVIVFFSGFTGCENYRMEEMPDMPKTFELTPASEHVIAGTNGFGIDLFTRVAQAENKNMALSPLSASAALTMLLNGTSDATFDQLRSVLGYPENMKLGEINSAYKNLVTQLLVADPVVELTLANAVFYRQNFGVKQNFVSTMKSDFGANVEGLDFASQAAVNRINQWASDNTRGKIPNVIESISDEMRLFLMNALYFKGNWTTTFNLADTRDLPFFLTPQKTVQVPTMSGEFAVRSVLNDHFHAVELPYGRGNFSMVLVVPHNQELRAFLGQFSPAAWDTITSALDAQKVGSRIKIYLPRFQFAYRTSLNQYLRAMGMVNAFAPHLANLSGIADVRDLFVHFVNQNTHIQVNEEGTTAAAVTTIGIGVTSVGPPPFAADRPFLFFIRERTTNTLMFAGAVFNPLEQ